MSNHRTSRSRIRIFSCGDADQRVFTPYEPRRNTVTRPTSACFGGDRLTADGRNRPECTDEPCLFVGSRGSSLFPGRTDDRDLCEEAQIPRGLPRADLAARNYL